jgi:hypothetical protein
MSDAARDRVVACVRALIGLVLVGVAAACSSGPVSPSAPSASPQVKNGEEQRCTQFGGVWRHGMCDPAGSGGGGGGGY